MIVVPGADTGGVAITDFSHTRRLLVESQARSRRFLLDTGLAGTASGLSLFRQAGTRLLALGYRPELAR
jgi:hypothetical protein